jgi:tetratricopeptide (TPR) repeat protein
MEAIMKKRFKYAIGLIFTTVIPTYLVVMGPEWFDFGGNKIDEMSNQEKIVYYSNEISDDPKDEDNYLDRGWTYYMMREYEKGISDFNKVIELEPDNDEAYFNRSQCYESLLQRDKAKADLKKCLELNPKNELAKIYWDAMFKK